MIHLLYRNIDQQLDILQFDQKAARKHCHVVVAHGSLNNVTLGETRRVNSGKKTTVHLNDCASPILTLATSVGNPAYSANCVRRASLLKTTGPGYHPVKLGEAPADLQEADMIES